VCPLFDLGLEIDIQTPQFFGDLFQLLLAAEQFLFAMLALGNIHDEGDDKQSAVLPVIAETDLHGEFGTVFFPGEEVAVVAHGPVAGVLVEAFAVMHMAVMETLGDQNVDGLSRQFVRVILEKAEGGRVEQDDLSLIIGEDDAFGSMIEEGLDLLLIGFAGVVHDGKITHLRDSATDENHAGR
jgi:hypothetical protein